MDKVYLPGLQGYLPQNGKRLSGSQNRIQNLANEGIVKMRLLFHILAASFLVLGGIGWFSGFFPPWYGPSFEMPLGDLDGIAVDSDGNIYCAAEFYDRIQKYDPNGQFIVGW